MVAAHAWAPLTPGHHAVQAAYLFVFTFHMPAFIFIAGYFTRTGLGAPALNSHVTEIANAAGLSRAANPRYCEATWQLFWDLQQEPERLAEFAVENRMVAMAVPQSCAAVQTARRPATNRTAAPLQNEAAIRN